MYTARIVVLVIALGAGGVAAYLASSVDNKPPAPVQQVVQGETVDVLAAKTEIGLGQTAKSEDLRWQTWPKSAASGSLSNTSRAAPPIASFRKPSVSASWSTSDPLPTLIK